VSEKPKSSSELQEDEELKRALNASKAEYDAQYTRACTNGREAQAYARHLGTKQGLLCSSSATYNNCKKRSCPCGKAKAQIDPYEKDGFSGFSCSGCNNGFPEGTLVKSCQDCVWDMCMECINDDEENNEDCVVM